MTASRIGDLKTYVTLNELLPNNGLIYNDFFTSERDSIFFAKPFHCL